MMPQQKPEDERARLLEDALRRALEDAGMAPEQVKETIRAAIKAQLTDPETVEERKAVFKQAFQEMIDEQMEDFGRNALKTSLFLAFAAVLWIGGRMKGLW